MLDVGQGLQKIPDLNASLTEVYCSKCGTKSPSVFRCPFCGYNINFDPLGVPMGDRSFYNFRYEFWKKMGTWRKLELWFQGDRYFLLKRYKIKLKRRLKNLLTYFFSQAMQFDESSTKKQFYLELRDLIIEMIAWRMEKEVRMSLKDICLGDDADDEARSFINALYQDLSRLIESSLASKRDDRQKNIVAYLGLSLFLIFFLIMVIFS